MPHPRILKELGMTAAEWGRLPIESESPIRNELKEKAARAILARDEEERRQSHGLAERVIGLESRVSALESRGGTRK